MDVKPITHAEKAIINACATTKDIVFLSIHYSILRNMVGMSEKKIEVDVYRVYVGSVEKETSPISVKSDLRAFANISKYPLIMPAELLGEKNKNIENIIGDVIRRTS